MNETEEFCECCLGEGWIEEKDIGETIHTVRCPVCKLLEEEGK
jgi:hypothetical protein